MTNQENVLKELTKLKQPFSKRDAGREDWMYKYQVDSLVWKGKLRSLGKGLFEVVKPNSTEIHVVGKRSIY